jgi:hypothetical protein
MDGWEWKKRITLSWSRTNVMRMALAQDCVHGRFWYGRLGTLNSTARQHVQYLAFALTTETPEIRLSFLTLHSEWLLVINFAIFWLKRCSINRFQWILRNLWFICKGLLYMFRHLEKKNSCTLLKQTSVKNRTRTIMVCPYSTHPPCAKIKNVWNLHVLV